MDDEDDGIDPMDLLMAVLGDEEGAAHATEHGIERHRVNDDVPGADDFLRMNDGRFVVNEYGHRIAWDTLGDIVFEDATGEPVLQPIRPVAGFDSDKYVFGNPTALADDGSAELVQDDLQRFTYRMGKKGKGKAARRDINGFIKDRVQERGDLKHELRDEIMSYARAPGESSAAVVHFPAKALLIKEAYDAAGRKEQRARDKLRALELEKKAELEEILRTKEEATATLRRHSSEVNRFKAAQRKWAQWMLRYKHGIPHTDAERMVVMMETPSSSMSAEGRRVNAFERRLKELSLAELRWKAFLAGHAPPGSIGAHEPNIGEFYTGPEADLLRYYPELHEDPSDLSAELFPRPAAAVIAGPAVAEPGLFPPPPPPPVPPGGFGGDLYQPYTRTRRGSRGPRRIR